MFKLTGSKQVRYGAMVALVISLVFSTLAVAQQPASAPLQAQIARMPLAFEPNLGQADPRVKYLARGQGYLLMLTDREAALSLSGKDGKREVVRLELAGAARKVQTAGLDALESKTNYFLGNDPAKWRTNISNYGKVRYAQVYPGIDLLYYGKQNSLEHDFIIAPNADPAKIALQVKGAKSMSVDQGGNLILTTESGRVQLDKPFIYQVDKSGQRTEIAGGYQVQGPRVTFRVGAYDKSRELVIDPVLNYSTYFGGDATTTVAAITVDASGNAYITGSTASTSGSLAGTNLGSPDRNGTTKLDVFVAKISATGGAVTFTSIIGAGGDDIGRAIAVDGSGNVYVAGQTSSGSFPTTSNAYRTTVGNVLPDAFVLKLNNTGSSLSYSTYLNGGAVATDGADNATGVAVDAVGHILVVGSTASTTLFPASFTFGPQGANAGGTSDAFALRINPAGTGAADLMFGTYWGDTAEDAATSLAIVTGDRVAIGGFTKSSSFPVNGTAVQGTISGSQDGFIVSMPLAASFITSITCIDTTVDRRINMLLSDGHGFAVGDNFTISNVTASANITFAGNHTVSAVSGNTVSYQDNACNNRDGQTGGITANSSRAVGRRNFSTFLGGNNVDSVNAVAVDGNGAIYAAGTTTSTSGFPNGGNAIQSGGLNTTASGTETDAFVAKLANDGTAVTYSAYLGGTGNDSGTGIVVNPTCTSGCEAYVVGTTASGSRFNSNALQSALSGTQDGFVARVASAGTSLIYSTYFGGAGTDSIAGAAATYSGTAGATNTVFLAANTSTTIGAASTFGSGASVSSSAAQTATAAGATGTAVIAKLAANNAAAPTLTVSGIDSVDPIGISAAQTSTTVYTWTVTNTNGTNAATNVTLDVPTPQTSATAAATANLAAGAVTNVTVNNGGFGYNAAPTATFTGGDGAGATAGAVTVTNGVVTAVAVAAGGAGYTVAPTVGFTGGTTGSDLISIASTNNPNCSFKAGTATQPGGMTCVLGNIAAANGTASVQVTASPTTAAACVNSPCPLNTLTLNARANGAEPSALATGSVNTSLVPVTNLQVTGSAVSHPSNTSTYTLGTDTSLTYSLTVTNNSGATIAANDAALDVLITVNYSSDPNLVISTVTLNGSPVVLAALVQGVNGCFNDTVGHTLTCNVTSIAAGGTATLAIDGSFSPGTLNPAVPLLVTTSKFPSNSTAEIFTANGSNTNVNIPMNYTGPAADLQVTAFSKAADPVRTGQDMVYTVTVDNAGPNDATSVKVTLNPALPNPVNTGKFIFAVNSNGDGTVPVTCTQPGGDGTVINCVIANADMTVAAPALTFTVTGTLTLDANVPTTDQQMTATIITTGATSDTNAGNSTANVTTTVRREAALSVSAFSAPTTVANGQSFNYTFNVANSGLDNATGTVVTLNLPQNANAVTFTGNGFGTPQACAGTTTVTCTIGTINAAASGITITVTVTPSTLGAGVPSAGFNGSITNIASPNVVSTGGTKTAANLLTTVQRQTTVSVSSLTNTNASNLMATTGTATYTLDVSNTGANPATNAKIDFTVPSGTTSGTAGCSVQSSTVIRCNVASVPTGGIANKVTLSVSFTPSATFVPSTQASAAFGVSATFNGAASTENIDSGAGTLTAPASGTVDVSVERRADVQLFNLTATPTVSSDGNITVQAQVQNLSGVTATNVQVVFTFNHNYRFVSANVVNANGIPNSPAFSCTTSTATTRTCTIPDLPLTTLYTFNVIVQPEAGIIATNNPSGNSTTVNVSATITASVVQNPNTGNDTSGPQNTDVQRQANLRASGASTNFAGPVSAINSSATATYNLTVRNDGPDTVNGATVVFTFTNNVVLSLDTSLAAQTAWAGLGTCVRNNASTVTCTMAPGFATGARSGAITITPDAAALLASTNSAPYDVTASLSSPQAYDNGTNGAAGSDNGTAIVTTTVQRQADLRLTKSGPAAAADAGTYSYTITVQNFGPDAAGSVRVIDPLPSVSAGTVTAGATGGFSLAANGANFTSPNPPGGVTACTPVSGSPTVPPVTVVCMLGPLNNGESATITITGQGNIDPNVASASFNNIATVDAASTAGAAPGTNQTATDPNNGNNANTVVSTTISRSADLVMTNINNTPVLIAGGLDPGGTGTHFVVGTHKSIQYDITVQNNAISSTSVTTASVQTTLPATLQFDGANSPGCTGNAPGNPGGVVNCAVAATLTPGGATATVSFQAIPGATLPTGGSSVPITVTPTVNASGNTDPDSSNNQINSTTTIDRVSDLGIAQTAPTSPIPVVSPGPAATFTYTWTLSNAGPSNATGVVVANTLPTDLQFVSASWPAVTGTPSGSCTGATSFGATITCNVSTMNTGATVVITVTVRPQLLTTIASKQVLNQPVITGLVQDNVSGNNSDFDLVELRGKTDLQVTIAPTQDPAASAGQVLVGDNQTWTVTVTNAGPYPAGGAITLTPTIDPANPNVAFVSIAAGAGSTFGCIGNTCTLSTLPPPGQGVNSQTVTVVTTTPASAVSGQTTPLALNAVVTQYSNGTTVASDVTDPNLANNTATASVTGRAAADVGVTQTAAALQVAVGQSGNKYTVTVTNVGAPSPVRSAATNVVLTNSIAVAPGNSVPTTASGTPSQGTCNAATGLGTATITISCPLGTLASGASATVTLAITPTLDSGTGNGLSNTPTVTATEVDPVTSNNTGAAIGIKVSTTGIGLQTFSPTDSGGQPVPAVVITGTVTGPGATTINSPIPTTNPGVNLPPKYQFGTNNTAANYYTINNTTVFSGSIQVCIKTPETFFQPSKVRIFLASSGVPADDRTVAAGYNQTTGLRQVCGLVNSLASGGSTFVVMEPINTPPDLSADSVTTTSGGKGSAGTSATLDGRPTVDPDTFKCMKVINGVTTDSTCTERSTLIYRWVGNFIDITTVDPATGLKLVVKDCGNPPAGGAYPPDGNPCDLVSTSLGLGSNTVTLTVIDEFAQLNPSAAVVKTFTVGVSGSPAGGVVTQTVGVGQTGTFTFPYTFNATTTFSVTGTPSLSTAGITCTVQPNPLNYTGPIGGSQTTTITVLCATSPQVFASNQPQGDRSGNMIAGLVGLTGLPLVGIVLIPARSRRQRLLRVTAICALVLLLMVFQAACGGGGTGGSFGGAPKLVNAGTAKGDYVIQVNATPAPSGGNPVKTLTLTVQ